MSWDWKPQLDRELALPYRLNKIAYFNTAIYEKPADAD